jgi:hypothetical protein
LDNTLIITAYCIIDDIMRLAHHDSHRLAEVTDAEVLLVVVVSAMYFQNNHERALCVMGSGGMRYLTKPLSTSRFNRRAHALAWLLEQILDLLGQAHAHGQVYIIDSMPIPVCKSVRARRCRKQLVRGRLARPHHYLGRCAAKGWSFYGWRLHLICTPAGVPVSFQMLPGCWHDLTPIYELTFGLPKGAKVYADKGYISAKVKRALRPTVRRAGVHLIAWHKKSMKPNSFEEWCDLKWYRHLVETANSQLESMGIQRLHARTDQGLSIKVLASLFALTCINMVKPPY